MILPPVVAIDLATPPTEHESDDRRRLADLDALPDGTRVRVIVGSRAHVSLDALHFLRPHRDRLNIQIEGNARAAAQWHAALAGDAW